MKIWLRKFRRKTNHFISGVTRDEDINAFSFAITVRFSSATRLRIFSKREILFSGKKRN